MIDSTRPRIARVLMTGGLAAAAFPFGGWAALLAGGVGLAISSKAFPLGERPWSSLAELLKAPEYERLEFKETAFEKNGSVSKSIPKAVAGLANSSGGDLLIGVRDDGSVRGLEQEVVERGGRDRVESAIRSSIADRLGKNALRLVRTKFELSDGLPVFRIEVLSSDNPVFCDKQFFERQGNQTHQISAEDLHHR